ncbi:1-phosphofructokinase family hexose kinase [Luteolibacter sp. SL250]|uniref:1-phosphofructokinase family hexose kinase n=1 Tax=Luteolibacter sp. SL250 TaxID=2995170 RepID=UPI00226F6C30|nr:1-phosphofructokinase family hexose kinase [Luteolibacter sp. SL250]WAC21372.1 1-phosphofructokinase family hexose kinase [Luteolibacter sp. SL250]
MAEIITITLNPAIDHTVHLETFVPGKVNRVDWHHRQAGGKGVNVAALLAAYGIPCMATGFLGEDNPALFEKLFRETGIDDAFIRIPGETRTGIKIIGDRSAGTTDINFPGLSPDGVGWSRLVRTVGELATPGKWCVFGGSLPSGVEPAHFRDLLEIAKAGGAWVAVDASGEALALALDLGVDLIKPNEHELAEVMGIPPEALVADPAPVLRQLGEGIGHIVLSMGEKGALFHTKEGTLHAKPPEVEVVSTVGAGDSLLAGYLAGLVTGRSLEARARLATAFAWSALEKVSRSLPAMDEIHVRMERVDVETW